MSSSGGRSRRRLRRVFFASLLLVLGLAIVCAVMLIRQASATSTISVNYVELLNERVPAVPESELAWPILLQALDEMDEVPRHHGRLSWRHESWPELRAWVESNQRGIELTHEAARKQHLGYVYGEGDPPYDPQTDLFFDLGISPPLAFRRTGTALRLEALVALEAGEGEQAARAIESLLRLSVFAGESPFLIGQLVGQSTRSLACDLIGMTLAYDAYLLDDADLERLDSALADLLASGCNQLDLSAERYGFYDLFQRLYTDDGKGNGILTRQALSLLNAQANGGEWVHQPRIGDVPVACYFNFVVADRRTQRAKYDEIMDLTDAWAAQPLWQRARNPIGEAFDSVFAVEKRYLPIGLLVPQLQSPAATQERVRQWLDATRVSIALERYRRLHGAWPESLEALVPELLEAVPVDRFDGKPLKYALSEGEPTLYAIGPDGDDDQGRPLADDSKLWSPSARGDSSLDGDIVLYPPAFSLDGE